MKRKHFLVLLMLLFTTSVMAQITTAALAGRVTLKTTGEEIIGATVQAVHEPSGTRYSTVTNIDGNYNIEGMRAGGPYNVTISYIAAQTQQVKGITLQLGETYNLNISLADDTQLIGEVVVNAKASKFATEKTGATTNIGQDAINMMPTVSRSIMDITRLSPYAGDINGFAGGDGRSTNFTIDGANFNNNFGLSSNLPGVNPISIDAIDQIQVVIAPFDVRQSNFIGGGINAVTKSGTNTLRGTAYTYFRDQAMRGNRINGKELEKRADEQTKTYGFTLGGPILKDKLFFFANVEHTLTPGQVIKYYAKGTEGAGTESACTIEDMNTVAKILREKYGYDPGSATNFPGDMSNTKFLARIDWNINDAHHLAFRFNSTKNTTWNKPNGNSADVPGRDRTTNRVGETSMVFSNSLYSMNNNVRSYSIDLNSRLSNTMSNQFLATYSVIEDVRGSNSSVFPFIDIMKDGHHYMSAGYELFSYNTGVKNNVLNIKDDFKWSIGSHNILAGLSFEHQVANNAFLRNGTGYYRFASLQDFIDTKPESAAITYGFNGVNDPKAQVTFNQTGIYLQDNWNATKKLKLTYGVRMDAIFFDNSDLATNKAIYNLNFNGKRIDTGKWPNTRLQVSPRVGFSYDVFGNRTLKLRGGTGFFAGRLPLVFFTNMPTNANMVQNTVRNITGANVEKLVVGNKILTKKNDIIEALGLPNQLDESKHVVGGVASGVSRDFKMPQVWKTSLAVDYVVPTSFPFTLTAEMMYTKNIHASRITNLNTRPSEQTFGGADKRPMYKKAKYVKGPEALMLENTSKGYGYTLNLTANLEPVENLHIMAAYTHTESKQLSDLPGNDPYATWSGTYNVNGANNPSLQRSYFVTPDKLIASASYYIPFKHAKLLRGTTLSLFYQGYSSTGNSFIYSNDMNGDGLVNDLMYIPANDNEISFYNDANGEQRKAFWKFVEQDSYLRSHKGQYAGSYAARSPFVHRFDFRLTEDFAFRCGKTDHKFQLSFDIENVGNMLNSNWGIPKYSGSNTQVIAPLKFMGVDANNVPQFTMNKRNGEYMKSTYETMLDYSNCWKIQVGLKYFFN